LFEPSGIQKQQLQHAGSQTFGGEVARHPTRFEGPNVRSDPKGPARRGNCPGNQKGGIHVHIVHASLKV